MKPLLGPLLAIALLALAAPSAAEPAPPPPPASLYRPLARLDAGAFHIELPASVRQRFETVSRFPIDRYGTRLDSDFVWSPQARVGANVDARWDGVPVVARLEYEHDLTTGAAVGAPDQVGERLPNGEKSHAELRKGLLRLDIGRYLALGGGYMMSHWGLGLLANDGDHGWTPGSAYFGDPRSGDRVLRAYIGSQPLTDYGLVLRLAYDDVRDDDLLLDGEDAQQIIASARIGVGQPTNGGIYFVYRDQDGPEDDGESRGFDAYVVDITGSTRYDAGDIGILSFDADFAVITGDTTLAPTPEDRKHDLVQFATVVRAGLSRSFYGFVAEFIYASGDQNYDDHEQNAFRIDPNYEVGLLLFRHVVAAQTGRAPVTAGDPTIVGRPVPDLDRVPTGGAVNNTISFFPRAWWRPTAPLELYGGPLFAWSEVDYADPFNTRVEGGGRARNPLGAKPGPFYGVELDLGGRYRTYVYATEVTLGLEAGVLFPGSALDDASGVPMDEVYGGRAMVDWRF